MLDSSVFQRFEIWFPGIIIQKTGETTSNMSLSHIKNNIYFDTLNRGKIDYSIVVVSSSNKLLIIWKVYIFSNSNRIRLYGTTKLKNVCFKMKTLQPCQGSSLSKKEIRKMRSIFFLEIERHGWKRIKLKSNKVNDMNVRKPDDSISPRCWK